MRASPEVGPQVRFDSWRIRFGECPGSASNAIAKCSPQKVSEDVDLVVVVEPPLVVGRVATGVALDPTDEVLDDMRTKAMAEAARTPHPEAAVVPLALR